ncbi:MAG: hypothetical protein M0T81_00340 [Thermoplasmatales archaeon]|nr:hypothetical protein [Thermoplasmatales archaeon]
MHNVEGKIATRGTDDGISAAEGMGRFFLLYGGISAGECLSPFTEKET